MIVFSDNKCGNFVLEVANVQLETVRNRERLLLDAFKMLLLYDDYD